MSLLLTSPQSMPGKLYIYYRLLDGRVDSVTKTNEPTGSGTVNSDSTVQKLWTTPASSTRKENTRTKCKVHDEVTDVGPRRVCSTSWWAEAWNASPVQSMHKNVHNVSNGPIMVLHCQLHRFRLNLAPEYLQSRSNISAVENPALARTQPVVFLSPWLTAPYRSTPLHLTTHHTACAVQHCKVVHKNRAAHELPPPQQERANNGKNKATASYARWPLAARSLPNDNWYYRVRQKHTQHSRAPIIWTGFPHPGVTRWRAWLRHYPTSRTVAGSIPDGVIGIFHSQSFWPHYGPGVDSASNRNKQQEYFVGIKAAGT